MVLSVVLNAAKCQKQNRAESRVSSSVLEAPVHFTAQR